MRTKWFFSIHYIAGNAELVWRT